MSDATIHLALAALIIHALTYDDDRRAAQMLRSIYLTLAAVAIALDGFLALTALI